MENKEVKADKKLLTLFILCTSPIADWVMSSAVNCMSLISVECAAGGSMIYIVKLQLSGEKAMKLFG